MPVFRSIFAAAVLGSMAMPASAADPPRHACLSKAEQRAAVAEHKAIPLGQAVKSARQHGHHGELVGARLCRRDDDLVYGLTLLARSGKVTRVTVDAENGSVMTGR